MRKFAILAVLFILAVGLPALAQNTFQLTVPFEFQVGTAVLPPGLYTFDSPSDTTLIIRSTNAKVEPLTVRIREIAADKVDNGVMPDPTARITFRMMNGRYVLHTVQTLAMTHAHDVLHPYADTQ